MDIFTISTYDSEDIVLSKQIINLLTKLQYKLDLGLECFVCLNESNLLFV